VCEQYVARADEPFAIGELWDFTERLEAYGIASFGWGAAWLADGRIRSHRDVGSFRDDHAGREAVGRERTTALLVHLRRPSKLSTIGLPDTQPFDDPAGRYSFSHNGDLEHHEGYRKAYREQGRLQGKADTEVSARWLEDAWQDDHATDPGPILTSLHDTFGGLANLAVLTADGTAHHYAGNRDNPVFAFRLGPIRMASTALYSADRSLFSLVAPGAEDRRLVALRSTATV
jgi:glutamine phosphoribosylpyrophosphate amidotransferase